VLLWVGLDDEPGRGVAKLSENPRAAGTAATVLRSENTHCCGDATGLDVSRHLDVADRVRHTQHPVERAAGRQRIDKVCETNLLICMRPAQDCLHILSDSSTELKRCIPQQLIPPDCDVLDSGVGLAKCAVASAVAHVHPVRSHVVERHRPGCRVLQISDEFGGMRRDRCRGLPKEKASPGILEGARRMP
jgi:hypothetical protein